jgi:hypothetical protein
MASRPSRPTRQDDFRLPPGVTMQKEALPGAGWAYVVRHRELGLLGRLVLQGLPSSLSERNLLLPGAPVLY